MKMHLWTIDDVNERPLLEVLAYLQHLYEASPWVVEITLLMRPFTSLPNLHQALAETVDAGPAERRLTLIRAHPDLVGRAAREGTLTKNSTDEQRAAGLGADDLTADERSRFSEYNAAYRDRFGFPFVICARENRKNAILQGFADRLGNDRDSEITSALREIHRIAWHRLNDLVADPA